MASTFMGLETNKRGLYTQQSALYTTGHNISNANTLGYSRQRVNMEATAGFPGIGLNSGTMPGFLGTGVQAGSIQRIRDGFVDQQYRGESNKLGFWDTKSKAITQMEDVLTEPSAYGLQKSLSEFWTSLQTLATNSDNGGARAVVVQRGVAVADSFNYMHKSLTEIQTNIGKEIEVGAVDVNAMLQQIADLNRQIIEVEPNGYMPNDLYDRRDSILDELSAYFPIEVERVPSGGRALAIAEGSVTVKLKMANGDKVELVNGRESVTLRSEPTPLMDVAADGTVTNKPFTGFTISALGVKLDQNGTGGGTVHTFDKFSDTGKMKSLVNSYGTQDPADPTNTISKGLYPDMIAELNKMAQAFAVEFNKVHKGEPGPPPIHATDLEGNPGLAFFVDKKDAANTGSGVNAGNITVNTVIAGDPKRVAASDSATKEEGNGNNAKKLAAIQFIGIPALQGATIQTFYSGVVGKLGVEGQQATKLTFNTATLLGAVSNRRDSISSVSLDEEMTDMIRFQQAYNASARMITVVDETLDKIINGMGLAGR